MPVARSMLDALISFSMGELLINAATASDIPVLIDLRERMLLELGSNDPVRLAQLAIGSRPWLEQAFADGRATGWLAVRDGAIIGGMLLLLSHGLPQYRSPAGKAASIIGLYVVPGERGAGIATLLVSTAVDHAREWGAEVVLLHAADKARPLYERLGFIATKEMRLQFSEHDAPAPGGCCT